MKTTYLSLLFIFFYSICFTQPIQKHNCGQHILLRSLLKSPEKLKLHIAEQKQLAKEEIENSQKSAKGIIYNVPIVFDVTHSVQRPGGNGSSSGGNRGYVPGLARSASALGITDFFLEVHADPDNAPSDGPNMLHLTDFETVVRDIIGYSYENSNTNTSTVR